MPPHRNRRKVLAKSRNEVGRKNHALMLAAVADGQQREFFLTRSPSLLPFLLGFQLPGWMSRVLNMAAVF